MTPAHRHGRLAVAAAALLVVGAAAGITADRLLQQRPAAHAVRLSDGTVVRLSDMHADPIAVFDRAVGLRPEQRTRVATILERRQAEVNAAWREAQTRFQTTTDSVIAEIAAELDPAQAARFRALLDQLHGAHRNRLLHH